MHESSPMLFFWISVYIIFRPQLIFFFVGWFSYRIVFQSLFVVRSHEIIGRCYYPAFLLDCDSAISYLFWDCDSMHCCFRPVNFPNAGDKLSGIIATLLRSHWYFQPHNMSYYIDCIKKTFCRRLTLEFLIFIHHLHSKNFLFYRKYPNECTCFMELHSYIMLWLVLFDHCIFTTGKFILAVPSLGW